MDIGSADAVDLRVESLGRPVESIKREAVFDVERKINAPA